MHLAMGICCQLALPAYYARCYKINTGTMHSVLEGVKILVWLITESSGHMHDYMIAVGMYWKVYKACMQVPLGYIYRLPRY